MKATERAGESGEHEVAGSGRDEVNAEVEALLAKVGPTLQPRDFDFRVRRQLFVLYSSDGLQKVRDALAMIWTYTSQKSRDNVKNWPAYLLTLLKKFEPEDSKGHRAKGVGRSGGGSAQAASRGAHAEARPVQSWAAVPMVEARVATEPDRRQHPEEFAEAEVVNASLVEDGGEEEMEEERVDDGVPMTFPPGWEGGRRALLEEISGALAAPSCPFTGEPLDCQATLVASLTSRLGAGSGGPLQRHVAGIACLRSLADCPRAAAAVAVAGQQLPQLAGLPDDATAGDAAKALEAAARARPSAVPAATTVLQDLGLELLAEVLRTPRIAPTSE